MVKQHMEGPHANTKKVEDEVRCHDCHGVDHKTMDDVEKASMPTPEICGECHKKTGASTQRRQTQSGLAGDEVSDRLAWAARINHRTRLSRLFRMPQNR
ncbi:MAG: hypothetical protein ABW161_17060 [Candidatus Thiodiazotropha sp.]